MKGDLRDALHSRMLASFRTWSSEEIAREVLKIQAPSAGTDRLVRAILAGDLRFRQNPAGLWTARSRPGPPLISLPLLLVETIEAPGQPGRTVTAVRPAEFERGVEAEARMARADGAGLAGCAALLESHLICTTSAGATRRQLHAWEQGFGLPVLHDRILDLSAALGLGPPASPAPPYSRRRGAATARRRRAQLQEPVPPEVEDPSLASDESSVLLERLRQCRLALERLLVERGDQPLGWIEEELEAAVASKPVDLSRYRFDRDTLAELPERPGIYRFRGEAESLLYIGKSRDLRRRVGSYFRPLARDHSRRAALLEQIRSLEWETTPSELEALLLESESIRRDLPLFNKQVEVHPWGGCLPARDASLGFLLCEGDPREVSVFLLRKGCGWARTRLPNDAVTEARDRAEEIVDLWRAGVTGENTDLPPSLRPLQGLEPPEAELVLRYARIYRSRLDSVILDEFPSDDDLAEALTMLAVRERPAWEPWDVRPEGK